MKAEDRPTGEPLLPGLDDEFDVLRELGRGGASVVYLAVERELRRQVAIKTIHPVFATDPEAVARLEREAHTLARLQHPNIVTFYGVRRLTDGGLAVVMQYVRGDRLKDRVRSRGALPVEEARSILADVAQALGHAHRHHIVHRDIKPENIYLDSELGIALLSDFGIARPWDTDGSLTQAGLAIGTPAYMAPEQIDGGQLDGRSDLYALGLVGWEMLSGERPWSSENLYGIIFKQKHEQLPPIASRRSDVPSCILEAINRALEKDPTERWPTADAFMECLLSDVPGAAALRRITAGATASPGDVSTADALVAPPAPEAGKDPLPGDEPTIPNPVERTATDAAAGAQGKLEDALTVPYRIEDLRTASAAGRWGVAPVPAQGLARPEPTTLQPSEPAQEPDDAVLAAQIQWALSSSAKEAETPDAAAPGTDIEWEPSSPAEAAEASGDAALIAHIQRALNSLADPAEQADPRRRIARPTVIVAAGLALALVGSLSAISLLKSRAHTGDDEAASAESAVQVPAAAGTTPEASDAPLPSLSGTAGEAVAAPAPTESAGATRIGADAPATRPAAPPREAMVTPRPQKESRTRAAAPPPPPAARVDSTALRGVAAQQAPAVAPRLLGQLAAAARRTDPGETARSAPSPPANVQAAPAATDQRADAGSALPDAADRPPSTPFDVAPVLRNRDEVRAALAQFYPSGDDSRPSGRVVVWVLVDDRGDVQRTQIKTSSGSGQLDRAAQQVAGTMKFSPALSRDRKVSVWVAVPIDFAGR